MAISSLSGIVSGVHTCRSHRETLHGRVDFEPNIIAVNKDEIAVHCVYDFLMVI